MKQEAIALERVVAALNAIGIAVRECRSTGVLDPRDMRHLEMAEMHLRCAEQSIRMYEEEEE